MKKLILASSSPRKKELLKKVGLKFKIIENDYNENLNKNSDPVKLVKELSKGKAENVANKVNKGVILSADMVVFFKDKIIGKPKDYNDAKKILKEFSGNIHQIFNGYTIVEKKTNKIIQNFAVTKVYFNNLSDKFINDYVERQKDILGKAGAYGIQDDWGPLIIEKIEGDYYNVVGLPLNKIVIDLEKFGIKI